MNKIINEIRKLEDVSSFSKNDRIVQGVINSINEKLVGQGEILPSVNNMIRELRFSRETIVKGYKDLISRGIIEAKNRRGYFVSNDNTDQTLNVALLMYNLDTFEEQFYRNFRHELGKNINLNTYFHHGNIEIFETILSQIKGKYGMYVVAPIPHPKSRELLDSIPRNKLMMFDRYEPLGGDFNHITQEFSNSSFEIFCKLAPKIKRFNEMIFFHSASSLDPTEFVPSFKKFLKKFQIRGRIIAEYEPGSVESGKVYFTLDNYALWQIIRDCKSKNLIPGIDLGVLSHNDEPAKEITGITTFSSDFSNMGRMAGRAILNKEKIQLTVPMVLYERHSL